jgi:hypothetical protein
MYCAVSEPLPGAEIGEAFEARVLINIMTHPLLPFRRSRALGDPKDAPPDGMHAEFARLYIECAPAYSEVNFEALSKLTPSTQILFGTDFDRISIGYSVDHFDHLTVDPTIAGRIARGNAEALFPRLKG